MNGQYIKKMELAELLKYAKPFISMFDLSKYTDEQLIRILEVTREPITTLAELEADTKYFFDGNIDYSEVKEVLENNKAERHLRGGMATREKYKHLSEK
jgi:hypothetical protein